MSNQVHSLTRAQRIRENKKNRVATFVGKFGDEYIYKRADVVQLVRKGQLPDFLVGAVAGLFEGATSQNEAAQKAVQGLTKDELINYCDFRDQLIIDNVVDPKVLTASSASALPDDAISIEDVDPDDKEQLLSAIIRGDSGTVLETEGGEVLATDLENFPAGTQGPEPEPVGLDMSTVRNPAQSLPWINR